MASPEEMAQTMRLNIPEKTGKNVDEWNNIIQQSKLEKHGQIVKMLKGDHGVTHGFANLIASDFLKGDSQTDDEDLVALQYAKKEQLKPIYEKLLLEIKKFGKELEIAPKKSYVSLRHKKQFALLQPSTKTRLDVGINLKGEAATKRLEASGSFNAMVSHRVRVTSIEQVDSELIDWLKQAFNQAK